MPAPDFTLPAEAAEQDEAMNATRLGSVQIAYDLAVSVGAKRVLQIGGWGELSVALAQAVHHTTGGRGGLVIAADLDGVTAARSRAELEDAGLDEYVHLCEGDARCTLQGLEGPFDLLWLGCSAELASDVLAIMSGRLRQGALVAGFAARPAGAANHVADDFEAAPATPRARRTRRRGTRLHEPAA